VHIVLIAPCLTDFKEDEYEQENYLCTNPANNRIDGNHTSVCFGNNGYSSEE
jgi:hypothetical protein